MLYGIDRVMAVLVDDDPNDRDLFKDAFSSLRVKSTLALLKDGEEALEFFSTAAELPHILFLDLNMPRVGGMEVLKVLRSDPKFSSLPIAIYSTSNAESHIESSLSFGANLCIVKTNSFEKLKSAIESALKIQWRYATSAFDIANYVMVIN
ncbi:response regulator [Flavobacterium qiangtangense]|uniref:Response regulator n=1 Tax=Flavobacterium qiangtangense TaxID=1442595 RepID=A0ABW1PIF4_9FLAO